MIYLCDFLLNNYMIIDTDRIINICLEFTDDIYLGPNIVNIEDTLSETDGMVFSPVMVRRSEHDLASVFLYESIVAVKMRSDYIEELGNKLAKYRLAIKECVSNREGDCVVKFIQLPEDEHED